MSRGIETVGFRLFCEMDNDRKLRYIKNLAGEITAPDWLDRLHEAMENNEPQLVNYSPELYEIYHQLKDHTK